MFFEIRTTHNTSLVHVVQSGRIEARHASALTPEHRLVLAYVPQGYAQCCFLVSIDEAPGGLTMWGEPTNDYLLPFRLVRFPHENRVSLAHPLSRLHVCGGPPEDASGFGSVVVNRPNIDGWETFDLLEMPADLISASARALCSSVDRILSYGLCAPGYIAAMRAEDGPASLPALRAIFSLLTHDESLFFAFELLADRRLVARLGNQMPNDPWLRDALPDLQDWLARRRPPVPTRQVLPMSLDRLDSIAQEGRYDSFGYHLNAMARRTVSPSKTLCIVSSARNEGIYLLEWIAYHRAIGVEQFFLYSNNNEDHSDDLLAALADAGEIVWLNNQVAAGRRAQTKALAHAFSMLPAVLDYRWTLVIDLDEFFVVDFARFRSAIEYLAWQEVQPVDVIKYNWLVFGSAGQGAWQDDPIIERLILRLPYIDAHVKSMVRSNRCIHSPPHYPILDIRERPVIRNGSGRIFEAGKGPSFSAAPDDATAWINHYFLKTAEEFVWKFSRNRGDELLLENVKGILSEAFVGIFMAQHRSPTMQEDRRVTARADAVRAEIARLEALPGVATARAQVITAFRDRLALIKAALRDNAAFRSNPTHEEFLACVP